MILNEIRGAMQEIKEALELLEKMVPEKLRHHIKALQRHYESNVEQAELGFLKGLLKSDKWPQAVNPLQICDEDSEQLKRERADGILSIILEAKLNNKHFLDFGTGEGHVANEAANQGATISVGYDIKVPDKSPFTWDKMEDKCLLTTDFEQVKATGPYNLILFYDVLDHVREDGQVEVLE